MLRRRLALPPRRQQQGRRAGRRACHGRPDAAVARAHTGGRGRRGGSAGRSSGPRRHSSGHQCGATAMSSHHRLQCAVEERPRVDHRQLAHNGKESRQEIPARDLHPRVRGVGDYDYVAHLHGLPQHSLGVRLQLLEGPPVGRVVGHRPEEAQDAPVGLDPGGWANCVVPVKDEYGLVRLEVVRLAPRARCRLDALDPAPEGVHRLRDAVRAGRRRRRRTGGGLRHGERPRGRAPAAPADHGAGGGIAAAVPF
mmetsp:Transcript_126577/g.394016  ORF Transcript_126577/g.394016 Transcript_126577/m.394016 type:complete len:253 (-) Transcript_126577:51-809(-)